MRGWWRNYFLAAFTTCASNFKQNIQFRFIAFILVNERVPQLTFYTQKTVDYCL